MGNLILKPATSGQLILQDEGGDSALSIDTSGNTTLAGTANNIGTVTSGTFNGTIGSSATGFGLITMADQWRLASNSSDIGTSPTDLTANWERADDATSGIIGTGMSESSGIFTFPETGIYQVMCSFTLQSRNGNNGQTKGIIYVSNDTGSSFDDVAVGETEIDQGDVAQVPIIALVDVTDENTHQVKFAINASENDVRALGSTSYNRTTISFIRLGDT